MLEKDFECQNFPMFEEVVHNFGRTDDDIIYSEKILIFKRYLLGLIPKVYRPYVIDHSHECVNICHVIALKVTLSRILKLIRR